MLQLSCDWRIGLWSPPREISYAVQARWWGVGSSRAFPIEHDVETTHPSRSIRPLQLLWYRVDVSSCPDNRIFPFRKGSRVREPECGRQAVTGGAILLWLFGQTGWYIDGVSRPSGAREGRGWEGRPACQKHEEGTWGKGVGQEEGWSWWEEGWVTPLNSGVTGAERPKPLSTPKVFLSVDPDREVPRDLLPLPMVVPRTLEDVSKLSRKVCQRLHRSKHEVEMVNQCVCSLNSLYSGLPVGKSKNLSGRVSQSQQMALDHILQSVQLMGAPPVELSCSEALRQLRAFDGYSDNDQVPCAVKSYSPSLLSLPEGGNRVLPVAGLMGEGGCEILDEFCRSRVLHEKEARSNLDRAGVRECCSDPLLKEPGTYKEFIKRLARADLIEFTTSAPSERVEAFFVGKKDGRLRMVVDCRRSNCWFSPPDKVRLCTAEALSRIELEPGSELTVCTADLKDAFYHFELPLELRRYFGMRRVLAGEVGISCIDGVALPMGWSHALWFCQMIHQRIVQGVGAGMQTRLEDRTAVPSGDCMHLEYVDNFVVLGTSSSKVSQIAEAGVSALREAGFVVHEEETSKGNIKILGWEFESTRMKPKSLRVWRVRMAFQQLLKTGVASGRQLEKVLGHANFISLGRREALSIFGETYTFIQRHYHIPHRLWRSVRRELEIWIGVSPLIWRDLALPWSFNLVLPWSTWGLGATTTSDFTMPEIQQLGRFSERWRFDIDEFKCPRASAFGVHSNAVTDEADVLQWAASNSEARGLVGQKPIQVVEQKPQSEVFQQTPFSSVQKRWRVCGRFAWKRKEPMPVLEGRASLFGVKHKLRSVDGFHKRHLFLTDSITAACSLDKGRGSSFKMRRVTQQIGALWLASRSCGHYRWLPSEWNPADGPSRGSRYPSVPVQYPADGHLPPAASVSPTECKALQKGAERSCNGAEGQEGEAPTAIAGSGIFSCSLGGGTVPEQISGMLQQVLPYDQPSEEQDQVLPNLGQCLDICADRNVWGRGRHQSGQLHDSGGFLFSARVQDTKDDRSPQHQAEPSRMAQTGSSQVPLAFTLASGLFDGEGGFQTKADTTRADDAVGVQCLPASWRDRKAAGTRFGASCDQAEILEPGSSSLRRGDPFQDRGVRRDGDAGPISQSAPDNLQGDERRSAPLFTRTAKELKDFMTSLSAPLKLENLEELHPYRLRHGGASKDFNRQTRTLQEIQRRGRWKSFSSVRRYEKGGRVNQLLNSLPARTLQAANNAVVEIPTILQSLR